MALPLATTTITVKRATPTEPDEPPGAATTLASGVRAHLSSPSGLEVLVGGNQGTIDKRLDCDPVDGLDRTCTVTDDTTGVVYDVVWADSRVGLGLDHVEGGLRIVKGRA